MSPGKTASQAGHAYLGSLLQALKTPAYKEQAEAYAAETPGTKVCLIGGMDKILRLKAQAEAAGIPHFLVVDSGCLDFYNGEPTVTAIGIGPLSSEQAKPLVGRFPLL